MSYSRGSAIHAVLMNEDAWGHELRKHRQRLATTRSSVDQASPWGCARPFSPSAAVAGGGASPAAAAANAPSAGAVCIGGITYHTGKRPGAIVGIGGPISGGGCDAAGAGRNGDTDGDAGCAVADSSDGPVALTPRSGRGGAPRPGSATAARAAQPRLGTTARGDAAGCAAEVSPPPPASARHAPRPPSASATRVVVAPPGWTAANHQRTTAQLYAQRTTNNASRPTSAATHGRSQGPSVSSSDNKGADSIATMSSAELRVCDDMQRLLARCSATDAAALVGQLLSAAQETRLLVDYTGLYPSLAVGVAPAAVFTRPEAIAHPAR